MRRGVLLPGGDPRRTNDDTPRLAFADWLEERGDPHGALVRVYSRLHQECRAWLQEETLEPVDPHDEDATVARYTGWLNHGRPVIYRAGERWTALLAEAHALLSAHRRAWTRGLPRGLRADGFWMGFPAAHWSGTGEAFLEHADRWLARLGPRHFLHVSLQPTGAEVLGRCLKHPLMGRAYALSLRWRMDDAMLGAVAEGAFMHRLRRLDLVDGSSVTGLAGVACIITARQLIRWWRSFQ